MDADSDEKRRDGDNHAEHDGQDGPGYDEWWELNDDRAYWRRRFLILGGGVVALGVCAWLLPGPHQPSQREAAASASMASLAKRQALPSAASGAALPAPDSVPNAYPTAPAHQARSTATASSTEQAKPVAKVDTAYHPKTTASPSASPSGAKAGTCAPADIVLSLFTSQASYPKGAHPSFSVYAVSTASAPCTLTYGAGSVRVMVTRQGQVVWDSKSCQPAPAQSVRFTRGVPKLLTIVWNPSVTKPAGCAGSLPSGASGTLSVVAMSHGQSSPVRTFKLER